MSIAAQATGTGPAIEAAAQTAGAPSAPHVVPGELIVRFRGSASAGERREARSDAGTELDRPLRVRGAQLLEVTGRRDVAAAVRELEANPDVLYAEPNLQVRATTDPPGRSALRRALGPPQHGPDN